MDNGLLLKPPLNHHLPLSNFLTNFTPFFVLNIRDSDFNNRLCFVIATFFHLYTYGDDSIVPFSAALFKIIVVTISDSITIAISFLPVSLNYRPGKDWS